MEVLYKYRLPFMEQAKVVLPVGAQILRVAGEMDKLIGGGQISMWAIVNTEAPLEMRTFHLFKTGGEMPRNIHEYTYIGCGAIFIQMELMMYVFEYPDSGVPYVEPAPFDWKTVAEAA